MTVVPHEKARESCLVEGTSGARQTENQRPSSRPNSNNDNFMLNLNNKTCVTFVVDAFQPTEAPFGVFDGALLRCVPTEV